MTEVTHLRHHRTVKLDPDTDSKLRELAEVVPVLTIHAVHLACIRAGIEAISADPDKLLGFLGTHKVRVPTEREV